MHNRRRRDAAMVADVGVLLAAAVRACVRESEGGGDDVEEERWTVCMYVIAHHGVHTRVKSSSQYRASQLGPKVKP